MDQSKAILLTVTETPGIGVPLVSVTPADHDYPSHVATLTDRDVLLAIFNKLEKLDYLLTVQEARTTEMFRMMLIEKRSRVWYRILSWLKNIFT